MSLAIKHVIAYPWANLKNMPPPWSDSSWYNKVSTTKAPVKENFEVIRGFLFLVLY